MQVQDTSYTRLYTFRQPTPPFRMISKRKEQLEGTLEASVKELCESSLFAISCITFTASFQNYCRMTPGSEMMMRRADDGNDENDENTLYDALRENAGTILAGALSLYAAVTVKENLSSTIVDGIVALFSQ